MTAGTVENVGPGGRIGPDGSEPAGAPVPADGLEEWTDDELAALALAADPSAPLADDAVPLSQHLAQLPGLLPQWYMPTAVARPGKRWRVVVVLGIVLAFVIIEALGLCSTFGQLVPG